MAADGIINFAETVGRSILPVHFYTFPLSFSQTTEAKEVPSKAIGAVAATPPKAIAYWATMGLVRTSGDNETQNILTWVASRETVGSDQCGL